ncbi:TIGR03086 family metal-binding protein [Mycolicibacterium sphagni]|uniref:TIGR03086 family protein n=1 Tax=Mycolicibacterium sphagni TaxID=1786 RepID=A0A255D854_9MYCO|nr:TIGR03086 family metal-binding protein [Mycolicibacterium sphagni]OYN75414.1 TIGR03086 family protein [Mycolicibacterium sphagni]
MLMKEHGIAVITSIELVDTVRPTDLDRPTPCTGWDLADLLAHMTVQHRGFAAAARGHGADLGNWRVETVVDAVREDPALAYAHAANDVLEAFWAVKDNIPFALPEFGDNAVFPAQIAMGFHFVDYVVHGWDVAAALGVDYQLPAGVLATALPIALAVPGGEVRMLEAVPFGPEIEQVTGAGDFDRVLRHLGRKPEFTNRETSGTTPR